MHVIRGVENEMGGILGILTNDSAIEDNDTDVSAMEECNVKKMLCMNVTGGDETRLFRHERYLYAQLRQAPNTQSVYDTTASQRGLHERGARG
jgi:hypothetical protein